MNYLGIDPGLSGAIAWVDSSRKDGTPQCAKMPETRRDMLDLLQSLAPAVCVIEKMGAIPGQWDAKEKVYKLKTKPSSFGVLMQNFGHLLMALEAADIPVHETPPGVWQSDFGLKRAAKTAKETSSQKKNRHKAKAQQLFPKAKVTLITVDAILLSAWCCLNRDRLFIQSQAEVVP